MLDEKNGTYLFNLFDEYEEQNTEEAHFVKSLDLFDMYLQAYEYELLNNLDLSEFFSNIPSYLLNDVDEKEETGNNTIRKCLKELLELRNKKINHLPPDSNLNTILKYRLKK